MHKNLKDWSLIFIRYDQIRGPLQSPYDGPYPVVPLKEKYFHILIDGKNQAVSIDKFKPALMTLSLTEYI